MDKYLPSKKFVFIFLSLIVALGLIYTPSLLKNQLIKKTPTVEVTTGTGDQKLSNRDPLIANTLVAGQEPTDKQTEETITALKEGGNNFENLTTTDQVSRELILQYINTKKAGVELTEAEKQAITDKALSYLPEFTFKTYSQKDILSTPAKDPESLRIYANNVAKIILDNLGTKTESVDTIIADADNIVDDATLNEEIQVIFQRFDPLIEKNKKSISDLLKIKVPEIFIQEHLQLLNSFEEIYEKLGLMQKSANDFIIVIMLRRGYYLSVEKLATSLQKMTEALIASQVTFSTEKDYGYQLFNVIMSLP